LQQKRADKEQKRADKEQKCAEKAKQELQATQWQQAKIWASKNAEIKALEETVAKLHVASIASERDASTIKELEDALKDARLHEERKLKWRYQALDKQLAQKEARLEEENKVEKAKLAQERTKLQVKWNKTCAREGDLRDYDVLKLVHADIIGQTRELKETSAVVEASANEAVNAAYEKERTARDEAQEHRRQHNREHREHMKLQGLAREEARLSADTMSAMQLSAEVASRNELEQRLKQAEEDFKECLEYELAKKEMQVKRSEQEKSRQKVEKERQRVDGMVLVGEDSPHGVAELWSEKCDGEKRTGNRAKPQQQYDGVDSTCMQLVGGGGKRARGESRDSSSTEVSDHLQAAAAEVVLLKMFGRFYTRNPIRVRCLCTHGG
jgi:hypothetical protein